MLKTSISEQKNNSTMRKLYVISMVFIGMCSCKKEYKQLTITDQALRDAMNIQVGSQFVYQDSITGEIDTYLVDRYDHTIDHIRDDDRKEMYETIIVSGRGSANTSFGFVLGRSHFHMNSIVFSSLTWGSKNGVSFPTHSGIIYSNPLSSNAFLKVFYNGRHESITLHSAVYDEVYEFTNGDEARKMHSFFSPQNGVIQFSTSDTVQGYHVWTLISSKIIKK